MYHPLIDLTNAALLGGAHRRARPSVDPNLNVTVTVPWIPLLPATVTMDADSIIPELATSSACKSALHRLRVERAATTRQRSNKEAAADREPATAGCALEMAGTWCHRGSENRDRSDANCTNKIVSTADTLRQFPEGERSWLLPLLHARFQAFRHEFESSTILFCML